MKEKIVITEKPELIEENNGRIKIKDNVFVLVNNKNEISGVLVFEKKRLFLQMFTNELPVAVIDKNDINFGNEIVNPDLIFEKTPEKLKVLFSILLGREDGKS